MHWWISLGDQARISFAFLLSWGSFTLHVLHPESAISKISTLPMLLLQNLDWQLKEKKLIIVQSPPPSVYLGRCWCDSCDIKWTRPPCSTFAYRERSKPGWWVGLRIRLPQADEKWNLSISNTLVCRPCIFVTVPDSYFVVYFDCITVREALYSLRAVLYTS